MRTPTKKTCEDGTVFLGNTEQAAPVSATTSTSERTPLTKHSKATLGVTESTVTDETFLIGDAYRD